MNKQQKRTEKTKKEQKSEAKLDVNKTKQGKGEGNKRNK